MLTGRVPHNLGLSPETRGMRNAFPLRNKKKKDKYNLEADCLSRNPVLEPNEEEDEQLKIVNLIKSEEVISDQKKRMFANWKKKHYKKTLQNTLQKIAKNYKLQKISKFF